MFSSKAPFFARYLKKVLIELIFLDTDFGVSPSTTYNLSIYFTKWSTFASLALVTPAFFGHIDPAQILYALFVCPYLPFAWGKKPGLGLSPINRDFYGLF